MANTSAYNYPNPCDNPENANLPVINRRETILGVTITFLSLAIIAISLRFWVRIRNRLWGWDDSILCLAITASSVGDIIVCTMPEDGLGLHFSTLHGKYLVAYFKHVYSTNVIYCANAAFIKLAILFQYLRLFADSAASTNSTNSNQYRMARRATTILMSITIIWGLVFTLLSIFSCDPISKNWDAFVDGKCIGWGTKDPDLFFATFAAHSATNMVLDVVVLLTPIPFMKTLQLAGKSKTALMTLFTLGAVVVAVSIGRLVSLVVSRAGSYPAFDLSFHTPTIYIFSILEVNIAILCASIPIFWPIITSLAIDKILVVNEVIVRVEENSKGSFCSTEGIKLTPSQDWPKTSSSKHVESGVTQGGRSKGLITRPRAVSKSFDRNPLPNIFHRSHSRLSSSHSSHRHNPSGASSTLGRPMGLDVELTRYSHDSVHNLKSTTDVSYDGKGSLTPSSTYDWFVELDQRQGTTTTTTRIDKG